MKNYGHFLLMIGVSTIIMFGMMYLKFLEPFSMHLTTTEP